LLDATQTRAGDRNRAILLALYDTGLRASELCSLDLADYDAITGALLVTLVLLC
jgi:site-specific recombinase XerD